MRITCPHCQHRGFSALAKLMATPAWPVRCKYCRQCAHPAPGLIGLVYTLVATLAATVTAAGMGQWPWWTVAVCALLLAGGACQLLVRPSVATRSGLTKRARLKAAVLAVLILSAVSGLLVATEMGGQATPAPTSP